MRLRGTARIARDERGLASVEFAFVAGAIALALLNVLDVARYYYQWMQLQNATQMAAQAAWASCDTEKLPAKSKCPGLTAAVTRSLQGTNLGSAVTLATGYPTEGYYCLNASNALQLVSDYAKKPQDCSAVGKPTEQPGDYISVRATYAFQPMFGGVSIGALLTSPLSSTAMLRLK